MSWSLAGESIFVPVRLINPLLKTHYPTEGSVMAVLDTGFSGFILTPSHVFRVLKLHELKTTRVKGELANGSSIELLAAYGAFEIPEIRFEDEGLIETNPDIKEILLGVKGIRNLRTIVDGCKDIVIIEKC